MTTILHLNKNHFENGEKSGEFFKKVINNNIHKYKKLINQDGIWNKCELVLSKLTELYPEYVDEIRGRASGAGVGFETYWAMMCPEIFETNFEHCTTIMCKDGNGHFLLSHNEDDDDNIEGNFCLSKIYNDGEWVITGDSGHMPFGNGFSWNSHGIIKTINYCHESDVREENIPRYFLQRHISGATSIDNLIERCNAFHPASGFHVNAIDRNTDVAVSIEVYPDSVDVTYIEDYYIHSNHYIHNRYVNCPQIDEGSNSIFRLYKAKDLFSQLSIRNLDGLKRILKYRDELDRFEYSIFQTKKDPCITGMNFSYSVADNNKIYLDVYPFGERLELEYACNDETLKRN